VFIKLIINIISIGNDLANTFFDFYIIIFEYDFNSYPELGWRRDGKSLSYTKHENAFKFLQTNHTLLLVR